MKTIRCSVFETNSNSTHSLCLCSEDEFEKWKKGELLFDTWEETFREPLKITEEIKQQVKLDYYINSGNDRSDWDSLSEELQEEYILDNMEAFCDVGSLENYTDYMNHSSLESFVKYHTTKSNEKVIAFGRYGHD